MASANDALASVRIPATASLDIRISLNQRHGSVNHSGRSSSSSRNQGATAAMDAMVVTPNKGLKGHVLLITAPWEPPQAWIDEVHGRHPGLRVIFRKLSFGETLERESLPDEDWTAVTVLLTGGLGLPLPKQMPKLQYVQLISAGANMILNQPLFADTDIVFATANGVHGPQISEWIIATYLALSHEIPSYLEHQRAGKWQRTPAAIEDSVGLRIGILGYGSIGRQTARVAKALAFEVYAYTLHPRDTPESRRDDGYAPPGTGDPEGIFPSRWFSGGSREDRHAFLSSGLDLLVVATPLTADTTHLLGTEELRLLGRRRADGSWRPGFLSNIARGPIVDTDALIAALDTGVLRGAAIDVTDPEPLPDGHPLWKAKNLIITPHVSGISTSYMDRVLDILSGNLDRLSEDRPLANSVSRREGY